MVPADEEQTGVEEARTVSRRVLIAGTGGVLLGFAANTPSQAGEDVNKVISQIRDPEIRRGVEDAVNKNILPAATQHAYPGYFNITADGSSYGDDATWPGLDSWQMVGAYLLLGKADLACDYLDFVRSSQRKDGNIPFAIFKGDTQPGSEFLRGLDPARDTFRYVPPDRPGLPASSQKPREWVGLFRHWELRSNPLSTLGPLCYVLTAAEIYATTRSKPWLRDRLSSVEAAAHHVADRIARNGLVGGSGFYTELPPREGFDGVTQCYAVHAFRELARLFPAVDEVGAHVWIKRADDLSHAFVSHFWRTDHFGEYVHVERGLVDSHGLSDTNWAAVAFGLADSSHLAVLWPRLMAEPGFWLGGMPTQTVTKPFSYEAWEDDPVPFQLPGMHHDVAAMGRVWYLEALACRRMKANKRLIESAVLVSRAEMDGFWRERYHPQPDGTVKAAGANKYCEYAAVLARIVLGNPEIFNG